MEIKIGVQNVAREIVLESTDDAEAVAKVVGEAINAGSELRLKDDKGRLLIVPGNALAYVEIGAEEVRRVGFGQF
ncbi:hypothetical protein QFZ35_002157 [Arthrobacter ulcerisalmonis]|uniref:DUF3107 domain-containing protein n=1 Tax=Arthrobacter sp. B1I2 TaxID=3042263 RepID=UPI00278B0759|nr:MULTISPECIES: DUF3107 domain-containing protein [Arthrobacter]MDQ0663659.1 hypothetical protein [Arthrobacter ulcerisalmonis]MDQ0731540.1 hypothetical protein [Arthrobacter sp. B1I2]